MALDPGGRGGVSGGASTDDLDGVARFISNIRVSYPVGLESTRNYLDFAANYKGLNPFPIDVLVGKDGNIAYVAREYDPDSMTPVLERLLSE